MRRQDPNQLTDRELEVLEFIRRDFTNEQIADRLGISLDGAKYHVSQILSKLGVVSREEAAAVAIGERRRWWAHWPLWARIAGATAIASAGAIAILIYATTSRDVEDQSSEKDSSLSVEEVYSKVHEAVTRPGFILHSTLDREGTNGDENVSQSPGPVSRDELWIDSMHDSLRLHENFFSVISRFIVAGDSVYTSHEVLDESAKVKRDPGQYGNPGFCPRSTDAIIGFLLCGGLDITEPPNAGYSVRLDAQTQFRGRAAVALVFEFEQQLATGSSNEQDTRPATPPRTPTCSIAEPVAPELITRILVDAEEFLPMARVNEYWDAGEFCEKQVSEYHSEFLRAEDLPADWFDPRSIGYQVETTGAP